MDRYQRVEKPRPESAIGENEIRITAQGLIRNYVSYAATLLQERRAREIVLKAMGQAINKTVAVVEIIKKRIPGLHQDTSIASVSTTDVWEPIEEGLVPLETTRHVSMISVTLSFKELNKNSPGYQAPLHAEQPMRQQNFQQPQHYQNQPRQSQDSYVRGRGRGRGGRGWGRGGYGGYNNGYGNDGGYGGEYGNHDGRYGRYGNNDGGYGGYGYNQGGYGGYSDGQENGGWNSNWGRGGGRGRGKWSYRGAGYDHGRGGGGGGGYGRAWGRMRGGYQGRGNQSRY